MEELAQFWRTDFGWLVSSDGNGIVVQQRTEQGDRYGAEVEEQIKTYPTRPCLAGPLNQDQTNIAVPSRLLR